MVGCNVVPSDREERSREWAVVSSDREIRSRYRLQSRQREYSVTESQPKSRETEWSAADSWLQYNMDQSVVGGYLNSKLKCRSHDETPSSRRGLK
jgi:hypothetical protein